jgi:hypothetical protein
MSVHKARIRIIESGGSPTARKALIRVVFEWELLKPIPVMRWKNVYSRRSNARIGNKGEGTWMHSLLGKVTFSEWTKTGGGIFGPEYENILMFEFYDIPFQFGFPFERGMKGWGMYHPVYTGGFYHGGIDWEVL